MLHNDVITGILSPHRSRRPAVFAALFAALIVGATLVIAPIGQRAGPFLPPVVLIYAVSMSLIEAMTAFFLAVQFRVHRDPFLGALAGAFGFVAILVFAQMLVFPGVISTRGLFSGSPQSSIWMWALWHAGFPLLVLLALLLRSPTLFERRTRERFGSLVIFAAPALAVSLVIICIKGGHLLPVLISGASYQGLRHAPIMAVIVIASFAALFSCVFMTRLGDLLSLWLAVALVASSSDAILTLSGAVRFDLGWYAGRIQSMLSASIVFCVLIVELSQIYGRLVQASEILARRVVRDGLTAAFNRGYFIDQFPREVRRAVREAVPISLIMVDVDHFKTYNDLYGHQQGDNCLIALVGAIQQAARRPGDIVARYGGEEFAVLLPRTDEDGALNVAREIAAGVAALNLQRPDAVAGRVTVSMGIATQRPSPHEALPEDLLGLADQALYLAKHEGRNTIRIAADQRMAPQPPSGFGGAVGTSALG